MTGKNKYVINAFMKKGFYSNIWTGDIKKQWQNAVHYFYNMQLKSRRGRDFTCMRRLENARITLNMFQNRCTFLYNSGAFLLSFFCIAQLHRLDFVLSWNFISRTIFTFLWPDSILLFKNKMAMETRLFILF